MDEQFFSRKEEYRAISLTMAELLLGEDGRGYKQARWLEGCPAWRTWLGDAAYTTFIPALASPAAWVSFLTSRSQLPLQFRARALLYDKASVILSLPLPAKGGSAATAKPSISNINPSYSASKVLRVLRSFLVRTPFGLQCCFRPEKIGYFREANVLVIHQHRSGGRIRFKDKVF